MKPNAAQQAELDRLKRLTEIIGHVYLECFLMGPSAHELMDDLEMNDPLLIYGDFVGLFIEALALCKDHVEEEAIMKLVKLTEEFGYSKMGEQLKKEQDIQKKKRDN